MGKALQRQISSGFRNDSADAGNAYSGKENDWISRQNRVAGKV